MPQVFRCRHIRDTFDKEVNKQISEMLTDPSNCFIVLRSKTFEAVTD